MVEDWQDGKSLAECNLHMLTNEIMCDVTFLVGHREDVVLAHAYILISRAPKVARLFADQMTLKGKLVILADIETEPFRQFLRYVYSDDIDLTSHNAIPLIPVAKKYGIRSLNKRCFEQILSEITPENACYLLELGHEYKEQFYICKCMEFIFANAKEVLKSHSFTSLSKERVQKVVEADELDSDEVTVFNALLSWADSRCSEMKIQPLDQNRRHILGNLLFYVRYTQMSVKDFTEKVSTKKILTSDEKIKVFRYFHDSEENLSDFLNTEARLKHFDTSAPNDDTHVRTIDKPLADYSLSVKPTKNKLAPTDLADLLKASRFRSINGMWKNNGPDAISFISSNTIWLCGIQVFATLKGEQPFDLEIILFDKNGTPFHRHIYRATSNLDSKVCSVLFQCPVRIQAEEMYTIQTNSKGAPVHCGRDGVTPVIVEDVRFNFITSSKSLNGTDVTIGQIPGLIFKRYSY